MNSASHPFSFHRHNPPSENVPLAYLNFFTIPSSSLYQVFPNRQIRPKCPRVTLSTCLHFPCPSACLSYLAVSPICLEVKEEEVSGKVSVRLAASALVGWVLGGLNGDGHYVGGWWEVWVAASWHLPLWHDVVDGCDGRERARGSKLRVDAYKSSQQWDILW